MSASDASSTIDQPVAFIGGGNMARSLIGGLAARGVDPALIRVVDPNLDIREALTREFGVQTFEQAADAVAGATTWVLATKPQVLHAVCEALAPFARSTRPLVLSVAAGVTSAQLDRWLGGDVAVVRTMPNTPALLGAGVTGLYANARVDAQGRQRADALMRSAGTTVWLDDEARMDAVTAVSGSGPAYVFLLAEAMEDAGIAQGLSAADARALVQHTLLGAARMLIEDGAPPAELRRRVTSPGGTTQAAIETFEAGGLRTLVGDAIAQAVRRGRDLAAAHD
ncbi:pyrroline-5-carboxylate reductase [Luteimonas sp BLCC-B24]|uniref:pyrroline-5-carboxylate reductase n=1 Tax=Luteimonas sp. BLCC-B24 TaxID=3025317 RepID=UPI00234D60CA|nr:pyrroline-5-carboxylate reductase [Luteimonas sp. BLCC-B24]MDC7806001.1 pyrroline-5-carboxylate reductase [Luteimonas sp. BLCC-B24]